jgi:hypothetical protein
MLVIVAKRPTFTPDQLKIGGNHLLYEVQMFCNTAALMEEGGWEWGWKDKTEYMAVLESFLMHTRSLMYFLCPPRGYRKNPLKERELFAEDYCRAHWKAKAWKGFSTERDNISVDLMHMSIDRLEVGRNWEYARMFRDLGAMLLDFVDHADDRLSSHLKSEIRAALVDGKRVAKADTPPSAKADGAYSISFTAVPGPAMPTTTTIAGESVTPAGATGLSGP